MATIIGLRIALTICGMVDVVVPALFSRHVGYHKLVLDGYLNTIKLRIHFTRSRSQFFLRRLKHVIVNKISPPRSRLLELPSELRESIWRWVCTPQPDGRVTGANRLLMINKQVYNESHMIFDSIEHIIQIGELERYKPGTVAYMGLPKIVTINESLEWHMNSLKYLVLEVGVCGIGSMTPDCFDVYIPHNGKEQWRNLKRLVGIWPEVRETPLESVRLDLRRSECESRSKTYRADFIRVIRNFKRTRVWAETGDCSVHKKNKSVLLPLVKAFNQGRRNWLEDSDVDNNLIVRYDSHVLSKASIEVASESDDKEAKVEAQRQKWSIMPSNDTSRSDNSVWPEWTGKEEKYIHDKMIQRVSESATQIECRECLASFDKRKELREHIARGKWRC